ncbi:glycoside hydrolase family 3 C-terminal domain-containing protein [Streptomyces sp. NPDC005921]|uniref:beta-glucosidase n=1 Tax=Streptomyces sp. NPDC005827 TaxID=3157070 RepID=UPI003400F77D
MKPVTSLVEALTLEEKVRLLTGRDLWSTSPIEKIGLRSIIVSDGPAGVRGTNWDERDPSLNFPSGSALAASWDLVLARRYGAALAAEARRKGVDVVLGPTVNLQRSPFGGRNFECFGEDPVLTADLAAAYVGGLQDHGVAAAVKHYVANDSETDRFTVDVRVAERVLREVYLLPFEKAVRESGAWLVMSSYNGVNGATMTENPLLETPLATEWGFDGVVISDWMAVRSLEAARAAQDLVMPGPDGPWGEALIAAVRRGEIDEAVVDRKVIRILTLAQRVGALSETPHQMSAEDGAALAREVAVEGTVLLENRDELPWDPARLKSVAVIGENAAWARTQGGGSAGVAPTRTVSPLDGVRAALPGVDVTYSPGAVLNQSVTELPLSGLTNPFTGEPGVRTRFRDASGVEIFAEDRLTTRLIYVGGDAPVSSSHSFELHTSYTPAEAGPVRLGFAVTGRARLYVDDLLFVEQDGPSAGHPLGAALTAAAPATDKWYLAAGRPVELRFVYDIASLGDSVDALFVRVGTQPVGGDDDDLLAEAARAATAADVALVVVGTNSLVESEGVDRESLALPGKQDELVKVVAAANPHTVVVVNSGGPVLLPWRHDVAALLIGHFGGQEFGHAIADVVLGTAEPGGRLAATWPAAETDAPVLDTTPRDGGIDYAEGVHVGHRAWLRQDVAPAYWFGSGRGYADIELLHAEAPETVGAGDTVTVDISLRNRSARPGKEVVQVYASRPDSTFDRPRRWLVGFAAIRLAAGESAEVAVEVPTRLFAHWDGDWCYEPGSYPLGIGTDAVDLPLSVNVTLIEHRSEGAGK